MLLQDKVVVVTGAARGMGRGIAEAAAGAGADLVLGDLDLAGAQETAGLVAALGRRALAVDLDVTRADSIDAAVARAVEAFGRIDGWVNNAGAMSMNPALDIMAADFDRQMQVNVSGLFLCAQAAARQMIAQGRDADGVAGAVVNIASNAGKVGYRNMATYNASKAAVINLTRSLSLEWAEHGINVNALCPGGVDTPMLLDVAKWVTGRIGGDPADLVQQMKPHQMARHIRPVEVGRVVAFLLSSQALIIRGQSINVDGGDTPY